MKRPGGTRGYTLIELLVVVAIVGLLTAVAIPGLLGAMNRARQKRTMADLRSICEGIEMYHQDLSFFPRYADVTAENLGNALRLYIQQYNAMDGWNRAFWYTSDGDAYTLLSYGLDGARDSGAPLGPTTDFDADIVFSNGVFTQWPEGVQK